MRKQIHNNKQLTAWLKTNLQRSVSRVDDCDNFTFRLQADGTHGILAICTKTTHAQMMRTPTALSASVYKLHSSLSVSLTTKSHFPSLHEISEGIGKYVN